MGQRVSSQQLPSTTTGGAIDFEPDASRDLEIAKWREKDAKFEREWEEGRVKEEEERMTQLVEEGGVRGQALDLLMTLEDLLRQREDTTLACHQSDGSVPTQYQTQKEVLDLLISDLKVATPFLIAAVIYVENDRLAEMLLTHHASHSSEIQRFAVEIGMSLAAFLHGFDEEKSRNDRSAPFYYDQDGFRVKSERQLTLHKQLLVPYATVSPIGCCYEIEVPEEKIFKTTEFQRAITVAQYFAWVGPHQKKNLIKTLIPEYTEAVHLVPYRVMERLSNTDVAASAKLGNTVDTIWGPNKLKHLRKQGPYSLGNALLGSYTQYFLFNSLKTSVEPERIQDSSNTASKFIAFQRAHTIEAARYLDCRAMLDEEVLLWISCREQIDQATPLPAVRNGFTSPRILQFHHECCLIWNYRGAGQDYITYLKATAKRARELRRIGESVSMATVKVDGEENFPVGRKNLEQSLPTEDVSSVPQCTMSTTLTGDLKTPWQFSSLLPKIFRPSA